MEPDSVTRVYLSGGGPPHVTPVFPIRLDVTKGEDGLNILERADFTCISVSVRNPDRDYFSCYEGKGQDRSTRFEVEREGHNYSTEYAALAGVLKKMTDKIGLTIIVY